MNGIDHVVIMKEKELKYYNYMNPLQLKSTLTTKFIMPMLFNEKTKNDTIQFDTFVNAYLADFNKPEYDDNILLVFEEDSVTPGGFKEVYVENNQVIYVYDIPEKWTEDYFTILMGDYTKISNEYKQHLLLFWEQDSTSDLYKILYKAGISYKTLNITKEIYNMEVKD